MFGLPLENGDAVFFSSSLQEDNDAGLKNPYECNTRSLPIASSFLFISCLLLGFHNWISLCVFVYMYLILLSNIYMYMKRTLNGMVLFHSFRVNRIFRIFSGILIAVTFEN